MKRMTNCGTVLLAVFGLWLWLPSQIAAAADLFESDFFSNTIYKFMPDGSRSTFASGLNGPNGLAFDRSGNLFVADSNSGNIYEFTPNGIRSTFASGLNFPKALAFDGSGNLFEADYYSEAIYKFTPDGSRSTFASGLGNPAGLAFDGSGNLFVTNAYSKTVYKFLPDGSRSTFATGLTVPVGLAFDGSGNLFVGDQGAGAMTVYKFTPGGSRSTFASTLNGPEGLAFDGSGNLFEADNGSGKIYKFTPDGSRSTFASGLNGPGGLAFAPAPVPEPSTFILLGMGTAGLLGFAWRRRRRVVPASGFRGRRLGDRPSNVGMLYNVILTIGTTIAMGLPLGAGHCAFAASVLAPDVVATQLSQNTTTGDRYRGYSQLSGDGTTVFFVSDSSIKGLNYYDLLRWRADAGQEVITSLEYQRWESSVSRPSTNFDGSRLSYRSRLDPSGVYTGSAQLYLFEEGSGIRKLFGNGQSWVYEPLMTPDGSSIYFTTTANIGGVNPRIEQIACRYDVMSNTVAPLATFSAPSTGDPNIAVWRGVSNSDRQLLFSNGNLAGLNPQNRATYYQLDQGTATVLHQFAPLYYVASLDPSLNLKSLMSADGRYALFSDSTQGVHLIDFVTGQQTTMPFSSQQRDYAISGDGHYVIYANRQSPISLYRLDVQTGDIQWLMTQADGPSYLEWHLSTDYSGNHIAIRSYADLTGGNPNRYDQVFLLTVPEPSTFVLLGMGGLGLLACVWRARKRTAAVEP